MKKGLTYYVCFSFLIGVAIYICEKSEVILPKLVRFYVNDFLIIPIVLFLSLSVIRKLKGNSKLKLSLIHVLYVCVMYSIVFEYWLPKFHPRYTSDIIDVGLYFLGGCVFYIFQKDSSTITL